MAEPRPDPPRYLHGRDEPRAQSRASVDVAELLERLAERTEELAEARGRHEQVVAGLKRLDRELEAERTAHRQTRERMELDCRELEAECEQVGTECRDLEAELAREREARASVEADLKRVQGRVASLQNHLQIAWAQLKRGQAEGERHGRWRRRRT